MSDTQIAERDASPACAVDMRLRFDLVRKPEQR
jgi:hypothetical protein